MTSANNPPLYELTEGYSIGLNIDSDQHFSIELFQNQRLSHHVTLHDKQCSLLTHYFCATTKELHDAFVVLLTTEEASVRVEDSKYLQVSFPIYFGREKTHSKRWAFKIELLEVSPIDRKSVAEVSLDPHDWNDFRFLGHRVMDDMMDYLRDLRLRPVWSRMPPAVTQAIRQTEIPEKGQSPWEVYEEVRSLVLPYGVGNVHPHYWGYVQGTGSPVGALAELITGTMNTMSWGGHQASIHLERQVLSWLRVLMGFPNDETSSGVLVSGTSVATVIAMAVARKKFANRKFKIYASKEVHNCMTRAIDLLDLHRENMVLIPTNAHRQIDIKALEEAIDPDACGVIVGTAGTVGTGAVDDLQSLADLCARRSDDLWFHVDGAIGAVARCSPRLRPLFAGIERADSIAFDLHKWLCIPYECGCILIRDGQLHKSTFSQPPASYLTLMDGGITPSKGETFYSDYGLELSRGSKALKVWMALKTYGIETLGQVMEKNVDQANYFARLVEEHPEELELLATGSLNIVCFRHIVSRGNPVDLDELNRFNKHLLVTIQERGIAIVSPLVVNTNTFALRMCITNQRTRTSDMDQFMKQMLELADELLCSTEYASLRRKETH